MLLVVLLSAAVALASAPYHAAVATMLPRVTTDDRLVPASAALQSLDGLATLAAPAVGGAMLLVAPPPVVLASAAALALAVAVASAGLPGSRFPAPRGRHLTDGLQLVLALREARGLLLLRGAVRVVLGVLLVVVALLPARLGLPVADVGFLQAALGLGGAVTAVLLRRRLMVARPASAIALAVVVLALACGAVAFEPRREVLLVALACAGAADVAVQVTYRLALLRSLPTGVSVVVAGAAGSVTATGLLIGTAAAAFLVRPDSTEPSLRSTTHTGEERTAPPACRSMRGAGRSCVRRRRGAGALALGAATGTRLDLAVRHKPVRTSSRAGSGRVRALRRP